METIEEKARAYDEAIKKAKSLYKASEPMSGCSVILETLFPELAQSEDEKVRKEIVRFIQMEVEDEIVGNKWLAWLEKQGQVKESHISQHENRICKENDDSLTSENEKVRKELIDAVQGLWDNDALPMPLSVKRKDEWISWLERQGDYANFRDKAQVGDRITKNEDGVLVNISQLERVAKPSEKQGEQKASYTTIVETGDGGINALVIRELPIDGCDNEQNPDDKVEPEFNVGDWIVQNGVNRNPVQITSFEEDKGVGIKVWFSNDTGTYVDFLKGYHKWTIQDAKDGDVLSYVTDEEDLWIMIYWSLYEPYEGHVHYHALLVNDNFSDKGTCCICIDNLKPATKEQRDLLFQKMHEAGYTFDFERKKLEKIQDEEYNDEGYGIDGLYHAQRILEKTIGKVDGYQSDDGILEHKCAITAVKKLYEHKPTNWSEEDESILQGIWDEILANKHDAKECEWKTYDKFLNWLKSLRPQNHWKPSKEQMKQLHKYCPDNRPLTQLYQDLKKLEEV